MVLRLRQTVRLISLVPGMATVVFVGAAAAIACGNAEQGNGLDAGDYEIVGRSTSSEVAPTATAIPVAKSVDAAVEREVHIVSDDDTFEVADFEELKNFKLSKEYDVEGLNGADSAIYGFFGPDPYDRQEFEIRFYPDHETALVDGVDFANEATGPDAVIASSVQRWDEGLVQRRACAGNTRGSHHSGRCDIAKYGDYVIAGNVLLLCQGKDTETALNNCDALYSALRQ